MFGGVKPIFGPSATGTSLGGIYNNTKTLPLGQSAFSAQQTTLSNAAQSQTSGLFGAASTATGFGITTTTQPAYSNFLQHTSNFGATQNQVNSTSLFGQPTVTSAFGFSAKPAGAGSLSQPACSTSAGGFGTFGQSAPTTTRVLSSSPESAFGQPATASNSENPGTSVAKYQPTIDTDTLMKGGQPNNVNSKQHCITALEKYECKSLEELRMEYYSVNGKGPQVGTASGLGGFGGSKQTTTGKGLFGTTAQPSNGLFGQPSARATENKTFFGFSGSTFGQSSTRWLEVPATQPFGAGATSGFGTAATDTSNPFGAKTDFRQTVASSMLGPNPSQALGHTTFGFDAGFDAIAGQQQQYSLFGQPAAEEHENIFGLDQTSTGNTAFGAFQNYGLYNTNVGKIVANNSNAETEKLILIFGNEQPKYENHPTGIKLNKVGYYTIPSMNDLKSFLAEDGSCVVPNFTVGREGYGNVYFDTEMDVAGLNLDEIVHFRNKEVIIYPDDDNKPPVGHGLNREAEVTLDQVWPLDKCNREVIKDYQRLLHIDWEGKLRRICDKNETIFVEYIPETGSLIFRVKHF